MRQLALVLGAGGQLGEALALRLSARHEVVAMTRADLDITDQPRLETVVASICPDFIVNCAAYTNVDAAEAEPTAALTTNALAVGALARAAERIDAALVHYSTDFVFDGTAGRPYVEEDAPNPQGIYAASKLLGEWLAAETPRHYVLRVESLFGGPKPHSSVDRLLDGLRRRTEVRAFVDRVVSPSYVDDVAMATACLLEGEHAPGLYHCVNSGWTTWAALAHEIARLVGAPETNVIDTRMADAGLVAARPQFAALSNQKLGAAGISLPSWQDALARHVAKAAER